MHPLADMPRVILGPPVKAQRAANRATIGRLRDNRIAATTLRRYLHAVSLFHFWLQFVGHALADDYEELDRQLQEYIEVLWEEGEPRALACDVLSGHSIYFAPDGSSPVPGSC